MRPTIFAVALGCLIALLINVLLFTDRNMRKDRNERKAECVKGSEVSR